MSAPKNILPTLLRAMGVILVSAFILFLFYPKERLKNQVVNTALEVLGNKLLAMVPKERERDVQREFDAVRQQALEGKVNEDHLEQFVTVVLNAEAEGKPLPPEKIDSSLAVLRRTEMKRMRNEKRLQQLAERMHAFEKFQTRWEHAFSDSQFAPMLAPHPRRPIYRVGPDFVVKIDTAALAQVVNAGKRGHAAAESMVTVIAPRPPLPPHVELMLKELHRVSPELSIEFEHQLLVQKPDSFRNEFEMPPQVSDFAMPPATPVPPPPRAATKAPAPVKKPSP